MFVILFNDDATTIDSTKVHEDSIEVDSAVVYEIPEIINFDSKNIARTLYTTQDVTPSDWDFNLTDAFFHTPFMSTSFGDGQLNLVSKRGRNPRHTILYFNNHPIDNPLFGYINLTKLPVQFIENTVLEQNYFGTDRINLTSKLNHYDKPFSYIRFTTGEFSTNLYNIDLSRPITHKFGFYLSGLYWDSHGYQLNSQFKIGSFYTNIYYNQIIPMRFDLIFFSNDYGLPGNDLDTLNHRTGKDKFIDACYVVGTNNNQAALYYTTNSTHYLDSLSGSSFEHNIENYGVDFRNYHNIKGYEIIYVLTNVISKIDSKVDNNPMFPGDPQSENSSRLWTLLNKSFNRVLLSVSNVCELRNTQDFFYAPGITFGFNMFDSTYFTGAVSRNYRIPYLSETYVPGEIPCSYWCIRGNENLVPEYYWSQELGIKRENIALTFYKHDYENLIFLQSDTDSCYTPRNIDSWQTIGVETYLKAFIQFKKHSEAKAVTEISAGVGGNYLFKGDSLPLISKGNSNLFISLKRETKRFGLGLMMKGQFVGHRQDVSGQEMNPFSIFSIEGTIRFMSLSFNLCFDNILNEDYAYIPNYTMKPRHVNFTVKWEFWD